jgi:thiamine-monophosphate kinase
LSKTLNSEFDFIRSIIGINAPNAELVVPNGDDAAVLRCGEALVAVSVDSLVEGTHFSFELYSPAQVGAKAIESAISDIVAMGGEPRFVLVAITAPKTLPIETLKEVFNGIRLTCAERTLLVVGGDTTSGGSVLTVGVTAIGYISDESRICRRSAAEVGDLVYVSGPLGGSAAGLLALQRTLPGLEQVKKRHLEPRCRADLCGQIGSVANALIDISDGLSSEIHHICTASNVGCLIYEERIPFFPGVVDIAEQLGIDPLTLAWDGGEDYELLFTISREEARKASSQLPGVLIGEITASPGVRAKRGDSERTIQPGGYDHFARR